MGARHTRREHEMNARTRSRRLGLAGLLAAVAVTLAVAVVSATADPAAGRTASSALKATSIYDWKILDSDPVLVDKRLVRLQNQTNNQCLVYGSRPVGINLKWHGCDINPNVFFTGESGNPSYPFITFDEPVAVHIAGGGYLYYSSRPFGINLKWSSTPKYEWLIRGASGHQVATGSKVALYNTTTHDYVVYCTREFGINLRWAKDCFASPSTTASVSHAARMGPFALPGDQPCTGNTTWRFEPLHLTGSSGQSTTLTFTRSYSVTPTRIGAEADYWCIFSTVTGNLRIGTWRIHALTPVWGASCDVTLRAGNQVVNFTSGRAGCSTDPFEWP
jgi:hypothetical protein